MPDSPAKPPNQLLSRNSNGEGVFDFDGVLDVEEDFNYEMEVHSDVDSFFSDNVFEHDEDGDTADADAISSSSDDDDSDSDEMSNGSDFSDDTFIPSDSSTGNNSENNNFSYDFDDDDLSSEGDFLPNYTPQPFPDDLVPFSENKYLKKSKALSAEYIAQLQISKLFNENKASIKMHDELIDIINAYIDTLHPPPPRKLLHHKQFLEKMEKKFDTSDLQPTYGSVRLTNNSLVTVPVFNMKAMILSILHDEQLMREENFAPGLDIFTGSTDPGCEANALYAEIHTGD